MCCGSWSPSMSIFGFSLIGISPSTIPLYSHCRLLRDGAPEVLHACRSIMDSSIREPPGSAAPKLLHAPPSIIAPSSNLRLFNDIFHNSTPFHQLVDHFAGVAAFILAAIKPGPGTYTTLHLHSKPVCLLPFLHVYIESPPL